MIRQFLRLRQRHRARGPRRTRGGVYVFVLAAIGLATVSGLVGLEIRKQQVDDAVKHKQTTRCRLHAVSGMEVAIQRLDAAANWRTTYSSGTIGAALTMPDGTSVALAVTDPDDGSLASGRAQVTSTATLGNAKQQYTLILAEQADAIDSIKDSSIISTGTIRFNGGTISVDRQLYGDAVQVSLTTVSADAKTVKTGLLAVVLSLLGALLGSLTTGQPPPAMPSGGLISLYDGAASALTVPGSRIFENAILTPNVNPWGATNKNGIYSVDAGGANITFRNMRVLGTIVVKNANQVYIQNAFELTPTKKDYAALIIDGNLTAGWTANLNEASLGINLNPTGSGFHPSDSANDDTYTSWINGYVYADGAITVNNTFGGSGPLIGESSVTASSANLTINRSGWGKVVPQGFESGSGKIVVADSYSFRRTTP